MRPANRIRPAGRSAAHRHGGLRPGPRDAAASHRTRRPSPRRRAVAAPPTRRPLRRPGAEGQALRLPHGLRLRRRPRARARSCACTGRASRTWARSSSSAPTATRPTTPPSRRARSGRRSVLVRVPRAAVTGRLGLRRVDGTRSAASKRPLTIAPADVELPAGVVDAEVQEQQGLLRLAQARPRCPTCSAAAARRASTCSCCAGSDGAVVTSWSEEAVEPGAPQTVEWDGTVDGKVASQGLYRFQVTATRRRGDAAPRPSQARRADRGRGAGRVPLPQVPLPDPGRARLRRGRGGVRRRPRPPGPRRLRRVRHAARRRARREGRVQAVPVARGPLPRDRRRPHRRRLRLHAPARRPRSSTRATRSRRAS